MDYKTKCVQCGKEFIITDEEANFYRRKGLSIPKRCKECREINKKSKKSKKDKTPESVNRHEFSASPGKYKPPLQRKEKSANGRIAFLAVIAILVVLFLPRVLNGEGLPTDISDISEIFTAVSTETEKVTAADEDVYISVPVSETTAAHIIEAQSETVSETLSDNIYHFRNDKLLSDHYKKHGIEMGFDTAADYEKAANDVISDPNALTKREKEDNDYVYYVEETNEFVILSTDGYIRTYFNPDKGIDYFNKQ